ncbi:MAG: sulfite exporter TauE/SafE family protein [Candidatus Brocadiaceae bacterium]|nr:sulfite exporter TauE/SafE family protein [Candidatus Brocadiaceae bacterium]
MDLSTHLISWIGEIPTIFVPFVILAASFIGSIHCIGMCGALALAASAQNKSGLITYHIGRCIGYFCVGSLAGLLGAGFIHSEMNYVPFISSIILGMSFLIIGYNIIKKGQPHIQHPEFLKALYRRGMGRILDARTSPRISGFFIGLLSPLLPCGWLYIFVLIAISTHNALWGGVLLTAFWTGTLPALSGISLLARKPLNHFSGKAKVLFGCLFILIGISSLVVKLAGISTGGHCCH